MPSKKKKYNSRFPPARIKKIMQMDEEIGKVAAAVPVIISRVLELFVESLITKTSLVTRSRNAKTLTISHVKACVLNDNGFKFLENVVADIPDVQGEDELASNLFPSDGNFANEESSEAQSHQHQQTCNKGTCEDSAGPSHSTADEFEMWSAEEDEDENGNESDENNDRASDHPVTTCFPSTTLSSTSSVLSSEQCAQQHEESLSPSHCPPDLVYYSSHPVHQLQLSEPHHVENRNDHVSSNDSTS